MKISHLVISLYFILFFVGCSGEGKEQIYPNIILIYADDMGYGDAQCYNSKSLIPTPNIDQLASEGMLFTDAHSVSAVCTPSRYSLLTGRYCWRTSHKKHVLWPWEKPLIKKERLTLPEILKEKGYQTGAIGKWHLGWNWPVYDSLATKKVKGNSVDYSKPVTGGPIEHGFDVYFGDDVPNFPPYTFIENNRVTVKPTIMKPDSLFGDKGMMAKGWKLEAVMPAITKKAVSYINEKSVSEKPFFLYLPLTAPHTPIAPTEQFIGKSKAGLYGDYVCEVDWVVGQIIKTLEKNNSAKNTIVIFTSDNGSPGRDGTNWSGNVGSVKDYGHLPNGLLRGYKGDIWEAGHRIPFIVRWPEKVKRGVSNDELICQVDIMRTIANIIGYELPENAGEDSYNILPALLLENVNPIREALVHHSWTGSFAIRKGKWKLIMTEDSGGFGDKNDNTGKGNETSGQLYNIENDIEEQNNLYTQYPEIVEELKLLLGTYIREGRSTPGIIQQNDTIDFEWEQIEFINQ
jgi:arylsulfatase A